MQMFRLEIPKGWLPYGIEQLDVIPTNVAHIGRPFTKQGGAVVQFVTPIIINEFGDTTDWTYDKRDPVTVSNAYLASLNLGIL